MAIDDKTKEQNRELAKTIPFSESGFAIQNLAQATLVAETMIGSGLVPAHFNSTAKIIVVAQAAKELGKPLWWGLNNMFVVGGKTGVAAAAAAGLVHEKKICDKWNISEKGKYPDDDFSIVITSRRKGNELDVSTSFSIGDAKTAGLWKKDVWQKYPKQMLTWRAVAFHIRQYYNDVLNGAYTTEELEDVVIPPPACDTPDRDNRRKPAQDVKVSDAETVAPDTDGSKEAESADNKEIALPEMYAYAKVVNFYAEKGGKDFAKYAAYVICGDEEDIALDKLTVEQLGQIKREIETNGVEKS